MWNLWNVNTYWGKSASCLWRLSYCYHTIAEILQHFFRGTLHFRLRKLGSSFSSMSVAFISSAQQGAAGAKDPLLWSHLFFPVSQYSQVSRTVWSPDWSFAIQSINWSINQQWICNNFHNLVNCVSHSLSKYAKNWLILASQMWRSHTSKLNILQAEYIWNAVWTKQTIWGCCLGL